MLHHSGLSLFLFSGTSRVFKVSLPCVFPDTPFKLPRDWRSSDWPGGSVMWFCNHLALHNKRVSIKNPMFNVFVKFQYFYSMYSFLLSCNKFFYASSLYKFLLLGYILFINKVTVITRKWWLILKYFLTPKFLCEYVDLQRSCGYLPTYFWSCKY